MNEFNRNCIIQEHRCFSLVPNNIHELPCRIIISDFLLWSSDPFLIWKNRTRIRSVLKLTLFF